MMTVAAMATLIAAIAAFVAISRSPAEMSLERRRRGR